MANRPYVIWKYAASLDGRIAAVDGSSRWITGSEARTDAHMLRSQVDVVMVGSGTQRADNPHLGVRHVDLGDRQPPTRVIVDTRATTAPNARVLDDAAPTIVAVSLHADAAPLTGKAEILRVPLTSSGLDLSNILSQLDERGFRKILLEGGPTLAGSFMKQGLIDEVVAYIAPILIGEQGRPVIAGLNAATITDAWRYEILDQTRLGNDLRITARVRT